MAQKNGYPRYRTETKFEVGRQKRCGRGDTKMNWYHRSDAKLKWFFEQGESESKRDGGSDIRGRGGVVSLGCDIELSRVFALCDNEGASSVT